MGAKPLNIYIDGAENSGRRSLLSWLQFGIFSEAFWKKVGLRDDYSRIQYSTIKHNKTDYVFGYLLNHFFLGVILKTFKVLF